MKMFSQRHFIAMAQVMANQCDGNATKEIKRVAMVKAMATMFQADNPRFKLDVFLKACKVGAYLEH